jgi:hypothetical protein
MKIYDLNYSFEEKPLQYCSDIYIEVWNQINLI